MRHIFDFLDEHFKELLEERAGILQFDAGYPKEQAEQMAMQQISEKSGAMDGKANGGKCE